MTTLEWGVEVTLVELKDIQLPDSMKRAMARQAEAEREKRAKIIAAEGESMAAAALGDASDTMMAHPLALQLRNLQTLVELGVDKKTTVVFPAPLMSAIGELGNFLARETAAATALVPPAVSQPGPHRIANDSPEVVRTSNLTHSPTRRVWARRHHRGDCDNKSSRAITPLGNPTAADSTVRLAHRLLSDLCEASLPTRCPPHPRRCGHKSPARLSPTDPRTAAMSWQVSKRLSGRCLARPRSNDGQESRLVLDKSAR